MLDVGSLKTTLMHQVIHAPFDRTLVHLLSQVAVVDGHSCVWADGVFPLHICSMVFCFFRLLMWWFLCYLILLYDCFDLGDGNVQSIDGTYDVEWYINPCLFLCLVWFGLFIYLHVMGLG